MAEGGKDATPKKERLDSITPDKLALMIEIINTHSDYKVITSEEFDKLQQSAVFTSTPARSKQESKPHHLAPPPPPDRNKSKLGINNSQILEANTQSFVKPRIPIFSGEDKSEVSFDVWKYEVKCIIREGNYSDTILLQSIRGSLKGKARSLLQNR